MLADKPHAAASLPKPVGLRAADAHRIRGIPRFDHAQMSLEQFHLSHAPRTFAGIPWCVTVSETWRLALRAKKERRRFPRCRF